MSYLTDSHEVIRLARLDPVPGHRGEVPLTQCLRLTKSGVGVPSRLDRKVCRHSPAPPTNFALSQRSKRYLQGVSSSSQPNLSPTSWAPRADFVVTAEEHLVSQVIRAMLADPDWLMPLIAAQVQYRGVYYGLTAAALLEDVWTDTLANWLLRHRPEVSLEKDARGASAEVGDYELGGMPISFKTGKGPTATAVHWDATVESVSTWSSPTTLTYLSAEYGSRTGRWATETSSKPARVAWPSRGRATASQVVALASQMPENPDAWRVAQVWPGWPNFDAAWTQVARLQTEGIPASSIEMFWLPSTVCPGDQGVMHFAAWPGLYLLPKSLLVDIPVSRNNRGTLITKANIAQLLNAARGAKSASTLFTRTPLWYSLYAPPRPPDLYLALRGSWDERFSPVTRHSQVAQESEVERVRNSARPPTGGE